MFVQLYLCYCSNVSIRMWCKASTIRQSILNAFSVICCWAINGICAIAICIYTHRRNGKNSQTIIRLLKRDKFGTSSGQVRDKLHTDNACIKRLVGVIGNGQLSVKAMMEGVGLKGRNNFLNTYLNPAIQEGYVCLLYPQSPRHPRQKYLLTVKGLSLWNEIRL